MSPTQKHSRKARRHRASALTAPAAEEAAPRPRAPGVWYQSLVLPVALVAIVIVTVVRARAHPPAPVSEATAPRPVLRRIDGPARPGEIEAREIQLPLPPGAFRASECLRVPEAWTFPRRDLESLDGLARWAGVSAQQVTHMRSLARCDAVACSVVPDTELTSSLSRDARSALYRELALFPENRLQHFAANRSMALGPWSAMPGLSARVRELLDRGTWIDNGTYAFSDLPWLCTELATDAEREEALATLRIRYGLDAWVRVPATVDLEPMVRYWGFGGTADDVRRALLAARAGDGRVPLASLLPPMARARLDRYPSPTDLEYDCFWTAANFFEGATPSDHMPGPDGIVTLVRSAYVEVPFSEGRMGDLAAFVAPDGRFAHTCNLVAGDVFFSKNGRSHRRPWALTRLADLRSEYPRTVVKLFRLR